MKSVMKTTDSLILGPDGRPIKKQILTEELAEAEMTGVRSVWSHGTVASYLSPSRLADVLERAAQGDHHDFLTLAEEMEERDLHYGGVLGTRKRALSGIEPEVEAASEDNRDVEIAQAVREQITDRPDFGDLVDDFLDALGKGYSAVEMLWETSARQWSIKDFAWRDPRFFNLSQRNGCDLLQITDANPMGEPLVPHRFIVHKPRLKAGLPIRGALARMAAVAYLCKGVALGDWMTFAELFGMPVRIGKYGNNATPGEKATLRAAVASLGSDAAAIMPESMKIEFIETTKGSGGTGLYETLCNFLDKQVSKGVVGQTMTSDDGSSQSQANVHNEVRKDILAADIRQLQNTLNQQLVKPFVDFNYGPQKAYPRITFPLFEPEDIDALVNALDKLVPQGLKVSQKVVLDKLGLPEPQKGEELLQAAAPQVALVASDVALNREQRVGDELDELAAAGFADWQPQLQPILDPLQRLADESETPEAFIQGLAGLLDEVDDTELVKSLAVGFFKARGLGDGQG
jgi:phage gp29-like protein